MVEVSNKYKSITVEVSSKNGNTVVAAKSDTAQYWSNQSHTFADQAKEFVQEAKNYAELANSYIEGFEDVVTSNTNNIIAISNDCINQIAENTDAAIDSINTTKTTILSDIEFVADGEKEEIRDLANDIKEGAEDIINRVGLNMFDTVIKDHILTYEESRGLALQGTYVYKNAVAGERYGYPVFYNKVIEEYSEATTTETVNGVTVKVHSNGHKFYNIADKTAIDNFFNTMGTAWLYGVDTENERIFLPRNNYFDQMTGDVAEVGQSIEAGLPQHTHTRGTMNITGSFTLINNSPNGHAYSGAFAKATQSSVGSQGISAGVNWNDGWGHVNEMFDASRNWTGSTSNANYTNSINTNNTVQPKAVKKLLYICVGNTTNYEGLTDVVNQGMEILEQVNQGIESRVNLDATNLNTQGKRLIARYGMPSNVSSSIALGASGAYYDAPANGYYCLSKAANANGEFMALINSSTNLRSTHTAYHIGQNIYGYIPAKQGDRTYIYYTLSGATEFLKFIYAEGDI